MNSSEDKKLEEKPQEATVESTPVVETQQPAGPPLTLGIFSVLFGWFIPIIGLIFGVIAIIQGNGKPGNQKLSTLGIIGVASSLVACIVWFIIYS